MLTAAGISELVAPVAAEYVRVAADLAADRPRLLALRASLRERLLASALCDAPCFAARFGEVVRSAWRERCSRA